MELCPSNDDIWLNWMVKLNNNKIKYSGINKEFVMIKIVSLVYLKNVKQNFNDVQIKRIIEKYGFPYLNKKYYIIMKYTFNEYLIKILKDLN